jgi:hypothetical protein
MEAMRNIDGTEFLFQSASGTDRLGTIPWHADEFPPYTDRLPIKVNVYLDRTRAGDGAIELIPGTSSLPQTKPY